MGKAAYGALMGLGQGISQWGGMMSADILSKQKEQREFDRQQSLLDIRQRYEQTQIANDRTYQEGVKKDDRTYAEKQRDEGRDYALEAFKPGTPEFEARTMEAEEAHNRAVELRKINPYGSSSSGPNLLSTYNQANFTPESWQPWSIEVTRLIQDEGMDPEMAAMTASQNFQLIPRQTSSPEGETAVNKMIMEDFKAFKEANPTVEDMRMALIDMGVPEEEVAEKSRNQLVEMAKGFIANDYSSFQQTPPPARGLMNSHTPTMGQPGSSQDNPVDATQFSAPPPSGTWVRLPDGSVRQVP